MMIKINLLPWRELERVKNKLTFKRAALSFSAITLCALIFVYFIASNRGVGSYEVAQKLLNDEIAQLTLKVSQLQQVLKEKKEMEDKIDAIYQLNYQRYQIVRFFNALSTLVPKGIFLNKVVRHKTEVMVSGESQSNALISDFMSNIQSRPVVSNPVLTEAKTPDENVTDVVRFQIRFNIVDKPPTLGKKSNAKK